MIELTSTSRYRSDWTARVQFVDDRAQGTLLKGGRVIRERFDVKHRNGVFRVRLSTGSGVSVTFDSNAVGPT